jgi:hypothetical protein
LEGDVASVAGYSHQGRLHAIGYMAGLRDAVYAESATRHEVEASVGREDGTAPTLSTHV